LAHIKLKLALQQTKAAQEGLFRKFGYESSPFADAIRYGPFTIVVFVFHWHAYADRHCSYKNAPKKLGFYSGAPPMRDEFSGTQATQRYREKIQVCGRSGCWNYVCPAVHTKISGFARPSSI
jgi:hypothetical protein